MNKSLVTLLAVCVLCSLTACAMPLSIAAPASAPHGCDAADIRAYLKAVREVSSRFDDAVTLASSTSRIALSPVISEMQTARREAQAAEVPPCTVKAQTALVAYMDATIGAFVLFIGDASDAEVTSAINEAVRLMDAYVAEMQRLSDEADGA